MTDTTTPETTRARTLRGTVVRASGKDTVAVLVERYVKHPKYKKFVRRTKKYLAHVPGDAVPEAGTAVSIRETRPISKRKRFELIV